MTCIGTDLVQFNIPSALRMKVDKRRFKMLHSIQAFKRRLELNVMSRGLNDRPSALLQRNGRGHSDGEGQHGLHEA